MSQRGPELGLSTGLGKAGVWCKAKSSFLFFKLQKGRGRKLTDHGDLPGTSGWILKRQAHIFSKTRSTI